MGVSLTHNESVSVETFPDLFWGVIASLYIGNAILLILNLPLIGIWVKLLSVPYTILFPLIITFCIIGAYSVNGNYADIIVLTVFGGVGYLMRKVKFDGGPSHFRIHSGTHDRAGIASILAHLEWKLFHFYFPSHLVSFPGICPDFAPLLSSDGLDEELVRSACTGLARLFLESNIDH